MKPGALERGVLVVCLGIIAACADRACDPADGGAPTTHGAIDDALPYDFRDVTAESGLDAFIQVSGSAQKSFIVETVGAGVALVDHDQDGDLDAYLTNGSRFGGFAPGAEPRDALFENDGAGVFTDVTACAGLGDEGWTNGVRVVDLDGDGWPDLYLTSYGPNVLPKRRYIWPNSRPM